MKTGEREKAVALRKTGLTYNEILEKVPVAKSTLSLWLREVGLAKPQLQRISEKKRMAQQQGADAKRRIRVERTQQIHDVARKDIGNLSKRELHLVGATLYWAEGSKAKPHSVSTGIDFGNTDPEMIKIFLFWLRTILQVNPDRVHSSLYLHINHKHRLPDVLRHWEQITKMKVRYVYYKKHNPEKTYRKNIADTYFGTLRIRVAESTDLQRKVQGWIYGITGEHCPVV